MPKDRIQTLDSFRCIAIIGVILYHFFVLFAPPFSQDYYPYHGLYRNIVLFRYGYLGVQFFFMISGFVIYMTLNASKNIKEFATKRFIRLWPTLLIFTALNYAILSFSPFEQLIPTLKDLVPTLTITEPRIWFKIFHNDFKYVDGVEWTLFVEVYFYIVAAIIFFFNKGKFFTNWLLYSSFIILLEYAISVFKIPRLGNYTVWLLFPWHISFFTFGMYFYLLYTRKKLNWFAHLAVLCLIINQLLNIQKTEEIPFILLFILLFILFIYRGTWLRVLSNRIFIKIGISSYSIYLFHNNVGVILIHYFSKLFNTSALYLTTLPAFILIFATCILVDTFVRKALTPIFKKAFLKGL